MNDLHPNDLLKMAKQEYQKEFDLRSSMKVSQNSTFNRWLAALGAWMVARGEKLQTRSAKSLQSNHLEFSQGKAKKARA
ncbi:MAG: hypothetical protein Q8L87_16245 [Anaerolineales bacterium]|nr:hypothetical protein [Anaerolineales bacterium]